jgi:hypothetical protein
MRTGLWAFEMMSWILSMLSIVLLPRFVLVPGFHTIAD